jgi:hypothetical protein
MISYRLQCDAGHHFDAWFRSISDYDRQADEHLVTCPICASTAVRKAIMAPAIAVSRTPERHAPQPAAAGTIIEHDPAGMTRVPVVTQDPQRAALITALRELKARIVANAEDVGEKFADEARRIHWGETEARGIYGQTTLAEARALIEEGIEIAPLPILPDERN